MTVRDWKPTTDEERLFEARFLALTGNRPFRWQWRLFDDFIRCKWPYQIDLPTDLGKTSVIVIWLLALHRAFEVEGKPLLHPRRLAYVVDRRVVVDQASEEAEAIVTRLDRRSTTRTIRYARLRCAFETQAATGEFLRFRPCAASGPSTRAGARTRRARQSLSGRST